MTTTLIAAGITKGRTPIRLSEVAERAVNDAVARAVRGEPIGINRSTLLALALLTEPEGMSR